MIINELHPDILHYYEKIESGLEKTNNKALGEFRVRIRNEEPKSIVLWLYDLKEKNLLPKEINEPLTNLYGSIR